MPSKNKRKKAFKIKGKRFSNKRFIPRCCECHGEIAPQHFYVRKMVCDCGYTSLCKKATSRHRILSLCKQENSIRWPLGLLPMKNGECNPLLGCSNCRFFSRNTNLITKHMQTGDCASKGRIVSIEIKAIDGNEHKEVAAFQLLSLADVDVNPGTATAEQTLYTKFKQFVRPDQAALALEEEHLCKHLLEEGNSAEKHTVDVMTFLRLALCNTVPSVLKRCTTKLNEEKKIAERAKDLMREIL